MILREMLVDDLDQVMEIEEELFSVPWTKEGFLTFLMKENGILLKRLVSYFDTNLFSVYQILRAEMSIQ